MFLSSSISLAFSQVFPSSFLPTFEAAFYQFEANCENYASMERMSTAAFAFEGIKVNIHLI